MPNITAVLNDQIRRLSAREITARTKKTRKVTAQYRRDIAALKRQVAALRKTVGFLERQEKNRVASQPVPEKVGIVRFRADGLRTHRASLGISAESYGQLVGVAGKTIYMWESGDSRPRKAQVSKLAAVRGIGKREALKRLELLGGSKASRRGKAGQRSKYDQTASELIISLLRSRKATTTRQINAAWKRSGRKGIAAYDLSTMVKAGKLKRKPLKGERGSEYRVA